MNKLHAVKTVVDGIEWASKAEAKRYCELKLLQRAGKISELRWQVPYLLIPAQYETYARYSDKTGNRLQDGKRCIEHKCEYIADFVYVQNGQTVVEDVKGYRDTGSAAYAKFVLKRKMMLYFHGIEVREYPPKH